MAVHLLCEGGSTGLDNRVLDRLLVQFHNLSVQLAPSGGSGGLGAVRVYLQNRSPNDIAIVVEDRDYFQTQAEAHAGWGNQAANGYIWRRHEIENYLLHPRVVLALFDDYRAAAAPWAPALPATEPDVFVLLQTVAVPLLENHAAEVLRVELLRHSTAAGNLQFGALRPPAPPGAIVAGQAAWVPALQLEAARLCGGLHHRGGPPGVPSRHDRGPLPSPARPVPGPGLPDLGGLPHRYGWSRIDDRPRRASPWARGAARIHRLVSGRGIAAGSVPDLSARGNLPTRRLPRSCCDPGPILTANTTPGGLRRPPCS
jgi:hypothetical protein